VSRKDAEALVAEIEAAWNSHAMARCAACFATDAEFVNVAGAWWRGREATPPLAGAAPGSSWERQSGSDRVAHPDVRFDVAADVLLAVDLDRDERPLDHV
jgi:uncharacterized protein (TIGR02246 family)